MSWPLVKVGEVSLFVRGVTFTPDDQVEPFSPDSSVVMRTKNVQVAGLDESDLIAIPSILVKRTEQILQCGDILISSANSWELVGKASYVSGLSYLATAGGFISIVRAKKSLIDSRYLYHWISSPESQHKIRHCGRQTTNISNLDVERFQELEIPLPPLEEQKRIAAILDKADAIRRKRQQAIKLADDFLRSVFLEMFGDPVTNPKGWDKCAIDAVCEVQGGLQVTTKRDGLPLSKPYLRVANVLRNKLDLSEIKKMNVTEAEVSRISLKVNDILVVEGHGNKDEIGRCAIWRGELEEVVHQNHLIRIRVDSELVTAQLVNDFINSSGGRSQMLRSSNTTSGLNTISTGIVKSMEIYLPPMKMQNLYKKICQNVSGLLSKSLRGKEGADEIFPSLSKMAFSGEL